MSSSFIEKVQIPATILYHHKATQIYRVFKRGRSQSSVSLCIKSYSAVGGVKCGVNIVPPFAFYVLDLIRFKCSGTLLSLLLNRIQNLWSQINKIYVLLTCE